MINYEEKENGEDEGSSEGGVPCAALSDDNFEEGSRVLVDFKGKSYNATIHRHREKSGIREYLIHYDGHKKSNKTWIPEDHIKVVRDVGTFSNEVEGGVPCAPHSTLIKRLHILNQTPSYRRSDDEKDEIDLLMEKLHQMKSRGEIGGRPCGLGTSWTYKKKEIVKHKIGRMVGHRNGFIVFPEIICTGDNPSLGEVISAIKRTKDTKIGKDVSIIEVPSDMLEYCGFDQIAQNAKSFITSRFEIICGLKNENGELEVYYCGEKYSIGKGRKTVVIPRRMFVHGKWKATKQISRGRFGLMCFSANRDKSDWDRCECDHMNGDNTDDREENVRWLTSLVSLLGCT